ncbi:MAG: hypothetical protein JKY98_09730 [Gammaproteobacteria bacterium]|nr:hypothetical protein [Gammaproteobacteria bacterium]
MTINKYGILAAEYYDPILHPTCANFRSLSIKGIESTICCLGQEFQNCLEVGAGKSVMAELRSTGLTSINHLTISDESAEMLAYSHSLSEYYESKIILDALNSDGHSNGDIKNYDLIVCSLGDPYNTASFWKGMGKLLNNNGIVIFTTPSYEWAESFRTDTQSERTKEADFVDENGELVSVPSYIHRADKQFDIFRNYGFEISIRTDLYSHCIEKENLSKKLEKAIFKNVSLLTLYCLKLNQS